LQKPIHRSTIHRKIKNALKTLKFDASAHSMRKLYAHTVFSDTHSLEAVQQAMHHQKIETTCAYLDIDIGKLSQIIMSQGGNT
jgi:site-specific recombinase XerC